MTYSDDLREFIKRWEGGPLLQPHWDSIGNVWDIGWGHVILEDEQRRDITIVEAEMLLDWDLHFFDDGVSAAVTVPLSQCEYDACVSLSYNVGLNNFERSSLLRWLNAGDDDAAYAEFPKWSHAGGVVIPGLLKRRQAEQAMFKDGLYGKP